MQNRFGLKDFVILVLLLAIGVSLWLAMFQRDREWEQLQSVRTKLTDLERQITRVEVRLESAPVMPVLTPGTGSVGSGTMVGARDESWARPDGGPIQWQEPWTFATDPRGESDFQAGGEFTEVFEAQPAKLTPYVQGDVYGRRVLDLVSESLGVYDPKTLKMRGWLAEAWQSDPNGLWLRVKINPRAKFSDGEPVTAEDMRWTFHEFVMNTQIEAERTRSTLDTFDQVKVISDRVVEFTFKEIYFLNIESALGLNVLPKHIYSTFTPAEINKATGLLVGSGPYKLEQFNRDSQWSPGQDVVLARNEQYWGPRPPLDRLRFKAINDELARLTEYKNDDADMITPSAPQFVSAYADPQWRAENVSLSWTNMRSGRGGVIWNCGKRGGKDTPFNDKRVRQAMTMLLDREKMIRDIWKGLGEVGTGFANPGTPGFDPDVKPWPFDPQRAMALLKEAGWEDRNRDRILEDASGNEFKFEFTYFTGGEISERIAVFIKDSYAAAGIRVSLRGMDWSVGDTMRNQRDFDAMFMGWGANAPESDPKQIFHSSSIADQGDNFAQWNSPAADAAIDAARREMDPVKRGALWRQFEAALHDEQPYTWVRVTPYTRFIKPRIGNINTYPKGLEIWEFYQRSGPPVVPPMRG